MKNVIILLALMFGFAFSAAEESKPSSVNASSSYQLAKRDLIKFSVQGEPETEVEQRIDGDGKIRIPYIGNVEINGRTVREAETVIERLYVEREIYHSLQATIQVLEYSTKEVSVLGQIRRPGRIPFPIEVNHLDIVDVITSAGGFTGIARGREVRVTRTNAEGMDEGFTVNVERMFASGRESGVFFVRPGDVIFVPERLF